MLLQCASYTHVNVAKLARCPHSVLVESLQSLGRPDGLVVLVIGCCNTVSHAWLLLQAWISRRLCLQSWSIDRAAEKKEN